MEGLTIAFSADSQAVSQSLGPENSIKLSKLGQRVGGTLQPTGAHTPAWGLAYLNPQEGFRCHKFQGTVFRAVTE